MPTLTPIDKNPFDEFYDATGADKPAPVGKTQLLGNLLFGALPGPSKLASLPLNENFRKGFMEGMEKSGRVGVQSMMEALENQYKPDNAVAVNDAGEWLDQSGKVIPSQRRPNLLPITKSQPGEGWFGSNFEGAMPSMADIWNTMGGVAGKGGVSLGAGPMLRPALKYQDKIYKAKEGQQHLDALPAHLQDTFQKMAMSGEDISHFNFGFINHKGHFLSREDALRYAIDNGILDPNDAKYGTLVTTMLNDSGGGQKLASQAAAQSREMKAPTFYSAAEKAVEGIKQNKASGDQWLSTIGNQKGVKGEELEWNGLKDFLAGKQSVTKQEIQDYLKNNKVELQEVWKGTPGQQWQLSYKDGSGTFQRYDSKEAAEAAIKDIGASDRMEVKPFFDKTPTKYHYYQLPGGENYRELLLTLPSQRYQLKQLGSGRYAIRDTETNKFIRDASGAGRSFENVNLAKQEIEHLNKINDSSKEYKSSHWDEPNILAHMRMNDRTIDGKKSLHLEEIQSDWHQQGRDKGYKTKDSDIVKYDQYEKDLRERAKAHWYTEAEKLNIPKEKADQIRAKTLPDDLPIHQVAKYMNEENKLKEMWEKRETAYESVPDAPFKKTWHELALKRAIREAAENGYERLSWTPGEAQAARYDLSKQVDKIAVPIITETGERSVRIDPLNGGTSFKLMVDKNGKIDGSYSSAQFQGKDLSDVVGKEMADKIMKLKTPDTFSGEGLKIGGEGMKGFYDQIIHKSIEKIAKEFGVKVQKGRIKTTDMPQSEYDKYPDGHPYKEKNNPLIYYIDIPENMRQSIVGKGQPLFSGVPTLTPVDYDPFKEEQK